MDNKEIKALFDKYIRNECTDEEIALLEKFLESYQKKGSDYDADTLETLEVSKDKVWNRVRSGIEKEERHRPVFPLLKYAAVIVLFIGSALYFFYGTHKVDDGGQVLQIEENAIILKTGDHTGQKLNILGKQPIKNQHGKTIATQSGTRLVYNSSEDVSEPTYNEIMVPYGKKFQLELSDGTVVHLNSGTSLRFPEQFIEGSEREVFLDGEAYFEVTKRKHQPFFVHADDMKVAVLGTRFVANSYEGNKNYTVLMEGSVSISDKTTRTKPQLMIPGQKAVFLENEIGISEVNANDYIRWLQGELSFNNQPFPEIIQKIERKYNVTIKNEYERLNDLKFRGRFNDETILDLMDVFKETAGFEYKIEANEIIITTP
ncbi:FecR domain-containing protein [Ulvibacterium sp.]|uniref:FecR family protein n=1 Tax=Ulvibacterium sp. TaxID=2665914 RepID=UPI0026109D82|nr:FecR domain-containing protein [Ulvibacterium sp.]